MTPSNFAKEAIWTRNFIVISFVNLFIFFSFQMIFPVLPLYIKQLGGTDDVIGLVMGIFTVSTVISRPVTGLLLDSFSKKIVLMFGLVIFFIAVSLYGAVHTIGIIILVRLLHGIGWGFTGTSSATIAANIIPKSRFAEGMGYFSLANGLSMAIAPAVGIYVSSIYGIHEVFIASAILAVLSFILASLLKTHKNTKPSEPTMHKELYEKASINAAVMMFFLSFTYGSIISFLPLYAYSEGVNDIGLFFTFYALTMLVTRPVVGKIIDRFGLNIVILPGFACLLLGITLLSEAKDIHDFLGVAFIYGLGFGALQTSLQTMAVRNIPHQRLGAATATLFTGFDLGMGSGVITLGAVAGVYGYSVMYLVTGIPIIMSMLFYIFHVRKRLKAKINLQ